MPLLSLLSRELGLAHLRTAHSTRDLALLYVSRFIRIMGFGAFAPVLILFLRAVGVSDERVGFFLSATLAGDVLVSLLVTWTADKVGRRNMIALGSLLMGASGVAFYLSSNFYVLLAAAIVGIISPTGNETGPFSALEQAALSQLTVPESRVYVLLWHQVLGFAGISAGNIATSLLTSTAEKAGKTGSDILRPVFALYAGISIVKVFLSFAMTKAVEVDHPPFPDRSVANRVEQDSERQPLLQDNDAPPASATSSLQAAAVEQAPVQAHFPLGRLVALCLIFGLDSFASSLAPLAFISYYFRSQLAAPLSLITHVFSVTALIGCASQLLAGSVAKRLGIIPTMVATHMPAQVFTIIMAFAPSLPLAVTFFIARACIASMDSSVRGAFLAAVIPKESRTRFLGIINISKTLASTPGPTLALGLAALGGMRWVFVITGSLKLIYDVTLFIGFKTAQLEH
ncbi:hypothetical protein JCM8547_003403 [Rhodosporidiobolus lusitaniae]